MNDSLLTVLVGRIEDGTYGEVYSLIIIRHGFMVTERYFRGDNGNTLHQIYSVTKSITSGLIGIAIDQNKINGVDGKLLNFFPEYPDFSNPHAWKDSITLENLLTMTAGFNWNEGAYPYGDPRNPTYQMAVSNNWILYMLGLPMLYYPGSRFTYNSGCTVLLSGILQNTTGGTAEEFARENLFRPLDITRYEWETGPNGLTNTGWGLYLRPVDMAKFGYLYLKNGVWEGNQIVSVDWVNASMTDHIALQTKPYRFGYQWWLLPDSLTTQTPQPNDIRFAWGYGDQFIFILPELDLVVVSTGGNFSDASDDLALEFLFDFIIKSINY